MRLVLPARPNDDPLDVIASPVATDVAPSELDRDPFRAVRDALDLEGRRPWPLAEQAGLPGAQQDRLECLAGARNSRPVPIGQEVIERAMLEVGREEPGELLGRQVHLLEQERLAAGGP